MAQPSSVPCFGNWEGDVPYTAVFDKARKDKGRRMSDQAETRGNTDMFPRFWSSAQAQTEAKLEDPKDEAMKHEVQTAVMGAEPRGLTDSPLQHYTIGKRDDSELSEHKHQSSWEDNGHMDAADLGRQCPGGVDSPKRITRKIAGSSSTDQSPLHQHHQQSRLGGRGNGVPSPSREKRVSSDGLAPSSPWRARLRPVSRGDQMLDQGAAVPRFGEWENNPSSADEYSEIFNQVREERQNVAAGFPGMPTDSNVRRYAGTNSKKCFCFPWGRN